MGGKVFEKKEGGQEEPPRFLEIFTNAATPILAPAKKDYGDVDFVVMDPAAKLQDPEESKTLAEALGATHYTIKNDAKAHFAVPWPEDSEGTKEIGLGDKEDGKPRRFVQIDIISCPDKPTWEWMCFRNAHGDMVSIFANFTRGLGLTMNERGLHVRIEEMENTERTRRFILLSQKPSDVLEFLGVDAKRWVTPFDSVQQLFEWVASSRFFSVVDVLKQEGKTLTGNDKRRKECREHFRMWIENFVPECRAAGRYRRVLWTREQVRDNALEYFGVQNEFQEKVTVFRKEQQLKDVKVVIKAGVPAVEPEMDRVRYAAIRGLQAIILEKKSCYGITPAMALQTEDGFYVMDEVHRFIQEHWLQVGNLEFKMEQARAAEKRRLASEAEKLNK